METGRASNPRREGSIPSRPAGAIVQQENAAFALQGSGCDSPSLHSESGIVAQAGERLDGIEEVAGASPAGSTTLVFELFEAHD